MIMRIFCCVSNPVRPSFVSHAVRGIELWQSRQQRFRRTMSATAVPVFRKQKDDGSGK